MRESDVAEPQIASIASSSSPAFDPGNFVGHVNNPYMIPRPGTTFLSADNGANSKDVFLVNHRTAAVDAVTCTPSRPLAGDAES